MNRDNRKVHDDFYEASYKVIMLGDSGVGKSNVLLRFTKGGFVPDSKPTVGVEFAAKTVQMENNKLVKAQVWDTAGQERYRLIASSYYRRAVGALLVYDVTDRRSFEHIVKWLREVEQFADEDCLVMLVGNKIDLDDKRAVQLMDGREFALKNKIAFIETSALDDIGIDAAFQHLLQAIYNLQENKKRLAAERGEVLADDTGFNLEDAPSMDGTSVEGGSGGAESGKKSEKKCCIIC